MKTYEGNYVSTGKRFAIVLSKFNETIGNNLLNGSLDCLKRHNVNEDSIDVYKVPGAFEIPVVADRIASLKKYSAIICLGAVIRGATPHFEYISSSVSSGIAHVALKHSMPVIFGVLTTDTIEQAFERSGIKSGNKGWEAALTALEMADLLKQI